MNTRSRKATLDKSNDDDHSEENMSLLHDHQLGTDDLSTVHEKMPIPEGNFSNKKTKRFHHRAFPWIRRFCSSTWCFTRQAAVTIIINWKSVLIGSLFLIAGLLFRLFGVPYINLCFRTSPSIPQYESYSHLRSAFPTQSDKDMAVIENGINWIREEGQKEPAVVILIATRNEEATLHKFSVHLASFVENSFQNDPANFIHINSSQYRDDNSDSVRDNITKMAHEGFTNGTRTFLIENVHDLPGNSPTVFMGLCDNQHAPFKNVLYIMTVVSSLSLENLDVKKFKVSTVWEGKIQNDVLPALEGRIGILKAVVVNEKT